MVWALIRVMTGCCPSISYFPHCLAAIRNCKENPHHQRLSLPHPSRLTNSSVPTTSRRVASVSATSHSAEDMVVEVGLGEQPCSREGGNDGVGIGGGGSFPAIAAARSETTCAEKTNMQEGKRQQQQQRRYGGGGSQLITPNCGSTALTEQRRTEIRYRRVDCTAASCALEEGWVVNDQMPILLKREGANAALFHLYLLQALHRAKLLHAGAPSPHGGSEDFRFQYRILTRTVPYLIECSPWAPWVCP